MGTDSREFYQQLVGFGEFREFPQAHWYQSLPEDWLVAISDVRGSTQAIAQGRYQEVNALGVASIVALRNALEPLAIPFVFGGDGATACLPAAYADQASEALLAARRLAREEFGLDLRVGLVPMKVIREAGYRVLVGKYQPTPDYHQAMFLGDGLGYAERLVKDPAAPNPYLLDAPLGDVEGHFEGFECRWKAVSSPHGEVISLLVQVLEPSEDGRNRLYAEVLERIDAIYGNEAEHHPLREDHLQLARLPGELAGEVMIRMAFHAAWRKFFYMMKVYLQVQLGRLLMMRKVKQGGVDWGGYKRTLIANTDYHKFDELLRMVISGTASQRAALRQVLEDYRRDGRLVYGLHAAPTALITCVVSNYNKDHIHFLDASDGGYALAAKEMKGQLADLTAPAEGPEAKDDEGGQHPET